VRDRQGDKSIFYSEGYKYQLRRDYSTEYHLYPKKTISTEWITLTSTGWLTIRRGYAWNGPSGPTFDTDSSLRGSLEHDAIYQLIRLGLLSKECKDIADQQLHDTCEEDGMVPIRADIWQEGVHLFGASSTKKGSEPKILEAP